MNPQKTDKRLAALYESEQDVMRQQAGALNTMHRLAGDVRSYERGGRQHWQLTRQETVNRTRVLALTTAAVLSSRKQEAKEALVVWADTSISLSMIRQEQADLDAVYRQDPWPRYFLVTSSDGHVHRGMSCSTCQDTTEYRWLPELSGCAEGAMIEEFGERACTVCFPAAPANPSFYGPGLRDREALAARAAEKATREAARLLKNLTPDEQFRDAHGDRITTVAACKKALRDEVEFRDYYGGGRHPLHEASVLAAEKAASVLLARGITQAEISKIIANAVKRNRKYAGARLDEDGNANL
jgi:hypothetical protein